ncbi:MAG: 2-C-methyl-D-erythritol 4-phosphate cytidylyltransferase [Actinomycetota bacterium]
MYVTAVLLGGGAGLRLGLDTPKQFLDLDGEPVFQHCVAAFDKSTLVDAIVLVLPRDHVLDTKLPEKVVSVTVGGDTRQDSLAEGLVCLPDETDIVVVHDAARPLVRTKLIDRVIAAVQPPFDGALAAIPFEDAVKEVSLEGEVLRSRERGGLWRAQTPQAFTRTCLEDALARAQAEAIQCEDCSEMATHAGYRVRVVMGDPMNIKLTVIDDLPLCESILRSRKS